HRTSPTNVGLSLLATIAAHDCGWIGSAEMADRLETAISETASLERFRGHLYNWYATQTRAPLEPRYVSTVHSGDLVAPLLVVKQACLEIADSTTSPEVVLGGIRDALRLARDSGEAIRGASPLARSRRDVRTMLRDFESRLIPLVPGETLAARLAELAGLADALEESLAPATGPPDE